MRLTPKERKMTSPSPIAPKHAPTVSNAPQHATSIPSTGAVRSLTGGPAPFATLPPAPFALSTHPALAGIPGLPTLNQVR